MNIHDMDIRLKDRIIKVGCKKAAEFIDEFDNTLNLTEVERYNLALVIKKLEGSIYTIKDLSKTKVAIEEALKNSNEVLSKKYKNSIEFYTDINNNICDFLVALIIDFIGEREFSKIK